MTDNVDALAARVRVQVGAALSARLQAREAQGLPPLGRADQRALTSELISAVLAQHAQTQLADGGQLLSAQVEEQISRTVLDSLYGLGGLQPLLDDPSIENISVNGCDVVWVRRFDGRRERLPAVARSDAELVELVRTVVARAGVEERRWDRASPEVSCQLPDGSRLHALMAVAHRPVVSIRRHRYQQITLDQLVTDLGMLNAELRHFLNRLVLARRNLLIAGGTGIGKTTFLRALAADIPYTERIITIEDSYELGLDRDGQHGDVVALQAREPNIEGEGAFSQADLARSALRMSPDRVIVGEVRGAEVIPMLNAMSMGVDGSMATIHASSSGAVFLKLAAYAAQAAERLSMEATMLLAASAAHFVIHLGYTPDGRRVVSSVREVVGADGMIISTNEVWRPGPDRAAVPGAPLRPDTAALLARVDNHQHSYRAPSADSSPDGGWAPW
ncbi:CpaF family protein [Parafrankia sp. BMG5.11]|uniref:CpaF family protein n=1 Tax=Parafrankia sp. BMG5.11 TaxID=222540 RepID=UPI0010386EDC|nr:ATPase, T2SS/T4P/T4SS family [Parafrankia sp. BMG5.11]TCJ36573.1 CpaF family protein [Parafrankia sp. BMG5.11]